jgi:dsDNA-specific endonuclease/ATPase MutS2
MAGTRRFVVGDHVHVASIGKGVVRAVRNGGRYLVDVKARQLVAAGAQLTPVEPRKQREAPPAEHHVSPDEDPPPRTHAVASIDLHGMTTDEAVAALDAFLNDAILAGRPEVRVIHGRSGGRLRAAVHASLKAVTCVRAFRVDAANAGVTVVTL